MAESGHDAACGYANRSGHSGWEKISGNSTIVSTPGPGVDDIEIFTLTYRAFSETDPRENALLVSLRTLTVAQEGNRGWTHVGDYIVRSWWQDAENDDKS